MPSNQNDLLKLLKSGSSVAGEKRPNPLDRKKGAVRIPSSEVLQVCKEGYDLDQIAEHFSVSRLSAGILVERLLKKGESISINQFINQKRVSQIEEILNSVRTSSIKKILEHCSDDILEEEIRLVRGAMIGRYRDDFS